MTLIYHHTFCFDAPITVLLHTATNSGSGHGNGSTDGTGTGGTGIAANTLLSGQWN